MTPTYYRPLGRVAKDYGIRNAEQLWRDLRTVLSHLPSRDRFAMGLSTAGMFRPDLALPAYGGSLPRDGVAPIFNLFDRVGGGRSYRNAITRARCRDYRGGRLTYDEHDGTDLVCPRGTPVTAAAPGVLVAVRDSWLRGGLTACVDHGSGVVTQYTHLSEVVRPVGEPLLRGAVLARSGTTGLDMLSGFPWVPPHVHFLVSYRGRPVDPFAMPGESPPVAWLHHNEPETAAGPLPGDPNPERLDLAIDRARLDALAERCSDRRIRSEIESARSDAARAAICEDSLHHERYAWPGDDLDGSIRVPAASAVRLTLPLPSEAYRTARPADARWTRPPATVAPT